MSMTTIVFPLIFSTTIMSSPALCAQPLFCGRVQVHRRRTILLFTSVIFTLSTIALLFNSSQDYKHDLALKPPVRLQSKSDDETVKKVFDPMKLLNSRTVGPRCDSLILIVVTSAPGNSARRRMIRDTWGKRNEHNRRYDWQYVFAIARSEDEETQSQVANEMNMYNDILYADFLDSYRNLTRKVIHAMAWMRSMCVNTKFLLKTDDDCFVNTVILPKLLQDYHINDNNVYMGRVFTKDQELIVLRNTESPWSLNKEELSEDRYPPYASGSGYVLSVDVVDAILTRCRFIKPFPVEDAYFGVVLASAGIEPINSGRFALQSTSWTVCNFLYLLVIHHVTLEDLDQCYKKAVNAQKLCHEKFISKWN